MAGLSLRNGPSGPVYTDPVNGRANYFLNEKGEFVMVAGGGDTLQDAYDNGNTIGLTVARPLEVTGDALVTIAIDQFLTLNGEGIGMNAGSGNFNVVGEFATLEAADTAKLKGDTNVQIEANGVTWQWPTADGSPGQMLTTNGSGVMSWQSAAGTGTVTDVSAQARGLANTDTVSVATPTTTPVLNLVNFAQGPNGEVSMGSGAPAIADVAAGCTVIGLNAGPGANDRAPNGVCIGPSAGTGADAAGASDLIAIGSQAAAGTGMTGASNICVGVQSGNTITTGSTNVCIGNQAGAGGTAIGTGTGNVIIGSSANIPSANASNCVVIGDKVIFDPTTQPGFGGGHAAFGTTLPTDAKYALSNNSAGAAADASAILRKETTGGANGAVTREFIGTRDPNATITGNAGDTYVRVDGANSTVYICVGGTVWTDLKGGAAPGGTARTWPVYGPECQTQYSSTNTIYFMRIFGPANMTLTDMGFLVTNANGSDDWLFGIYNEDLTTLLAEGSFSPATAGWVKEALDSSVAITEETGYWLAWKGTNGSASTGGKTDNFTESDNTRSLFDAGAALPANASAATASSRLFNCYLGGDLT